MRNTIGSAFVASTMLGSVPAVSWPVLADTPGTIPTAAQKLDSHDVLYTDGTTQFYWISSRVRPIDPGSQGLTWVWYYSVVSGLPGTTTSLVLYEIAVDCRANPIAAKSGYKTFGSNLNDFNMHMTKVTGTDAVMVPACYPNNQTPQFPQVCVLANLACEPIRFGAK